MKNKKKMSLATLVRLCVLMLALSLATMCLSFGTLAKYSTSDSHTETARVAKWGVDVRVTDADGFAKSYTNGNSVTVVSSTEDKVVAPGTSGSIRISIYGEPEVDTFVDASFSVESDIHIRNYYPVVFTLAKDGQTVKTGSLTEVAAALNADTADLGSYTAGESVDADYTLSWVWGFEGGDDTSDTELGNLIADGTTGDYFSTLVKYSLTITITQLD